MPLLMSLQIIFLRFSSSVPNLNPYSLILLFPETLQVSTTSLFSTVELIESMLGGPNSDGTISETHEVMTKVKTISIMGFFIFKTASYSIVLHLIRAPDYLSFYVQFCVRYVGCRSKRLLLSQGRQPK